MIVALVTCFVVAVVAFVAGYFFAWTRNTDDDGDAAHLAGAMIEQGRALADALHDLRAIERVRAAARAEWFEGGRFQVHPGNLQDAKLRLLDSPFLETFARRWGLALIGVGEVPVFSHLPAVRRMSPEKFDEAAAAARSGQPLSVFEEAMLEDGDAVLFATRVTPAEAARLKDGETLDEVLAARATAGDDSLIVPASRELAPFGKTLADAVGRLQGEHDAAVDRFASEARAAGYHVVADPATPEAAS